MDSRANHLSYEVLAKLSTKGALKNRVKFLEQNIETNVLIDAKQWLIYTRMWFKKHPYIYNSQKNTSTEIESYFKEINNYFDAWVEICNHREWEDNKDRWTNKTTQKGFLPELIQKTIIR